MTCKHTNIKTLHEQTDNRICINCYQHWYNGKEYTRKEWDAFVNSDAEESAKVGGMKEVLTFEEFASRNGASRQSLGEAALHRSSNRKSPHSHRKDVLLQAEKDMQLIERRDALREEYSQLVLSGEIRTPTRTESLIATARGHADNDSTIAARNLLAKKGIDW